MENCIIVQRKPCLFALALGMQICRLGVFVQGGQKDLWSGWQNNRLALSDNEHPAHILASPAHPSLLKAGCIT